MLRVATLLPVLALAACADQGDAGMYVLNNTAATGDSCTLSGLTSQAFISHGAISALSNLGYLLTPLIESRLQSSAGTDPTQHTIQLRGADVSLQLKAVSVRHPDLTYTMTQPDVGIAQFSALFSGGLLPAGSLNVDFEVIPASTLWSIYTMSGATQQDTLAAEVLATVTVKGDVSGDEVTADPFLYPVTVCTHCITTDLGACPVPSGTIVRPGNPCNPFQDGVVDCCTDASGVLVCPAPLATTLQ